MPSRRQNERARARSAPWLTALALCLTCWGLSGCGLFYENHLGREQFVLYSDHPPQFLEETAAVVERIYEGYSELFDLSPQELGRTTIVLEGESNDDPVVDFNYSPRLLGYYLPFLNLISLDTVPAWTRKRATLQQILLHEICHHFLITQHPSASSSCWLNEGLAGNLEMTVFDSRRFEYPLLNPPLLKIARMTLLADNGDLTIEKLVNMSWGEFHEEGKKSRHYALAWSLVYFLLTRPEPAGERPLGERIRGLYALDSSRLRELDGAWKRRVITLDLTGELVRMSRLRDALPLDASQRLTALWAIEQLGSLTYVDRTRAVTTILRGFDHEDVRVRHESYLAFLRSTRYLAVEEQLEPDLVALLRKGRQQVLEASLDPELPVVLREEILRETSRHLVSQPRWIPVFIACLEAPEGAVRATAAHGLARGLGQPYAKPTILNPSFWRHGPQRRREREVGEWRSWWAKHHPVFLPDAADTGLELPVSRPVPALLRGEASSDLPNRSASG